MGKYEKKKVTINFKGENEVKKVKETIKKQNAVIQALKEESNPDKEFASKIYEKG